MSAARMVLGLRMLAVMLGLVAGLWAIRPPRVEADSDTAAAGAGTPVIPNDSVVMARPASADYAVEQIIDGNIFSPSRHPPEEPYTPMASDDEAAADVAGGVTDDLYGAAGAMGGDSTGAGVGADSGMLVADDVVPRLYGTMITPGNASALLRLDSRLPTPQLYREGDRAGGFRVVRISEQAVTLAGSAGTITLRLPSSGKERP